MKYGMNLVAGVFSSGGVGEPMIMFMYGWIGLTLICAGWIAWRISARRRGAIRVLWFLLLWPLLASGLGVAGAAVGFPACNAAEDHR